MNELSEYLDQKAEIERLNKQINMIADFYEDFYKGEIKKLARGLKQQREMRYKERKWKEKALKKNLNVISSLLRLKNKKIIDLSLTEIAEAAFTNLSYVYKKKKELGL